MSGPETADRPQVVLRPVDEEDRLRLNAWRNLPDVARYMYTDHEISRAEHDAWFDRARADDTRRDLIIEFEGVPVGLASITDLRSRHGRCAWAFYLASTETRGKGVGSMVEFAVLDRILIADGFNKLWCEVLVSNEAVWRMHESFGFVHEAHFRRHIKKHGVFHDALGLGLLADDWRQGRSAQLEKLTGRGLMPAVFLPTAGVAP